MAPSQWQAALMPTVREWQHRRCARTAHATSGQRIAGRFADLTPDLGGALLAQTR